MSLQSYQSELIEHAMSVGALKFGSFTLKSGRQSPYFFNAGLLCTGPILAALSTAYAQTISDAALLWHYPPIRCIPFASTTALVLYTKHNNAVGFAYDRKEAKDHGEGGKMGKKVLILDDVMTSGKAVRGSIEMVRAYGGEVVGVVQALNREEVGQDGLSSTVNEIESLIGEGRVLSILKMRELMVWLEKDGQAENLAKMQEYWDQYGLK
ncbi:orotate phosphoribosyltransferase [Coprinellus micaceus]|uniref:orotate phosphoribosyltransferase n=1 Tax=Coprinellus micaceus TaxID=71717 RepID=A0A4Y7T6X5_COPMI|nr:orotate phosphoribosyltransferase [Coprinellus micaceus]